MTIKIIKKKQKVKKTSNLIDYNKTYRLFDWKQAESELTWFKGHKINAAYQAIDRHINSGRKNRIALYWQGQNNERKKYTFYELYLLSNQFGNFLKSLGVKKGDRVFFFLPRIPELYWGFLGTLKIGAVAGTLFSAFGPQALLDRLSNSGAKVLVTNKELYSRVSNIEKKLPDLKKVILVENLVTMLGKYSIKLTCRQMDPNEPAFMLYTSGTTGKPKGVVHSHQAILLEHLTAKWVLDIKDEDVYWCVPPETIVIANPKPRKINDLKLGDCVLTHTGEFHPIKRIYKRSYDGPLVKITTRYSNIPMFLTPNHKVLSGRRGEKSLDWMPSSSLSKKDYLVFPRIRKIEDRDSLSISKMLPSFRIKEGKVWRKKLVKKIIDKIKLDYRFMRLSGYYLAEGSIASHGSVVQFSFKKNEKEYVEDVLSLLRSVFNIDGYKLYINNLLEVRVNSVVLAELFDKLFGKKSYEKKTPQWFLYLPDDKISSLVKGFWRGDGDMDRDRFRFCTTSPALAYQLKLILCRLGLVPTFRHVPLAKIKTSHILERTVKAKHDCYYLSVGGKSLKRMSEILDITHPFLKDRLNTYQYAYVTPNYIWLPIDSVQKMQYQGEVYNLGTELGSYCLNNMIVHNCTADPGWVTGIAYEILGSWSNGASTLIYEGRFDPKQWYQLIEDYRISVWYTAPTAIRMLAADDGNLAKKYDLTCLRHLASVGEPLNPEAVFWGLKTFRLPFHDNWWQTETGGILIANYPCMDIKPGSMGKPVPGITAGIVDDTGKELPVKQIGNLAIRHPWPSMMIKIWKRPHKYQSYFKGKWYITGDLAYKDKEGYFWFVGRADDIIKTSGERVGPFEIESSLLEYPAVAEAGVIGKPDPLRGEIIKAFVVLKPFCKPSEALVTKLQQYVKTHLAGHAYPREIEFIKKLPKTRSGKIMRRVLKSKELGLPVGDLSALEE